MNRIKKYILEESASESIEKIILVAVSVIIAILVIFFYTYQVNKGATDGANKATESIDAALNS